MKISYILGFIFIIMVILTPFVLDIVITDEPTNDNVSDINGSQIQLTNISQKEISRGEILSLEYNIQNNTGNNTTVKAKLDGSNLQIDSEIKKENRTRIDVKIPYESELGESRLKLKHGDITTNINLEILKSRFNTYNIKENYISYINNSTNIKFKLSSQYNESEDVKINLSIPEINIKKSKNVVLNSSSSKTIIYNIKDNRNFSSGNYSGYIKYNGTRKKFRYIVRDRISGNKTSVRILKGDSNIRQGESASYKFRVTNNNEKDVKEFVRLRIQNNTISERLVHIESKESKEFTLKWNTTQIHNLGEYNIKILFGNSSDTYNTKVLNSLRNKDKPINAHYEFDFVSSNQDIIQMRIDINANSSLDLKENSKYFIDTVYDKNMKVLSSDGIRVQGSTIIWDGNTNDAHISLRYEPNGRDRVFRNRHFGVKDNKWALLRIQRSQSWKNKVREVYNNDVIRGESVILVGDYNIHTDRVFGQNINIIVPDYFELNTSADKILRSLVMQSKYLEEGQRKDNIYLFVTNYSSAGSGGISLSNNKDIQFSTNTKPYQNLWGHEYYHTRQDYDIKSTYRNNKLYSTKWLVEAEATYFQILLAYKLGYLDFKNTRKSSFNQFQENLKIDDTQKDVVISQESTWVERSQYDKGARIIAYLDYKIRRSTNSERNYFDVIDTLNNQDKINTTDYKRVLEDIADISLDEFFNKYVKGDDIPPLPKNKSLYNKNATNSVKENNFSVVLPKHNYTNTSQESQLDFKIKNVGKNRIHDPQVFIRSPENIYIKNIDIKDNANKYNSNNISLKSLGSNKTRQLSIRYIPKVKGNYNIDVIVTDGYSKLVQKSTEISVNRIDDTLANLKTNKSFYIENQNVDLNASLSNSPYKIKSYLWDLDNDGKIERETDDNIIKYTASRIGNVRSKVIVEDELGNRDSDTVEYIITDKPEIGISDEIHLNNTGSYLIDSDINNNVGNYTVLWELSYQNRVIEGETIRPTFDSEGTYKIIVYVEDKYGSFESKKITVNVSS